MRRKGHKFRRDPAQGGWGESGSVPGESRYGVKCNNEIKSEDVNWDDSRKKENKEILRRQWRKSRTCRTVMAVNILYVGMVADRGRKVKTRSVISQGATKCQAKII